VHDIKSQRVGGSERYCVLNTDHQPLLGGGVVERSKPFFLPT